jgi:magnesium and cobalt exporter, CNNM family
MTAAIVLVVVLTVLTALLTGSEIAFISLRESQIQRLRSQGERGRRAAELAQDPNRFLTTIQIGITLAGFLAAASSARTLAEPLEDLLDVLGRAAAPVALVLVVMVITYVTLVLGELVPKRIALQRAEGWSLRAARPLAAASAVARPAVWLLSHSVDLVVRTVGFDPAARQSDVTEDEVRDIIATQIDVTPEQRTILAGAFEVAERTLREIVVPRQKVTALAADTSVEMAARALKEAGHTRAPVYANDLDDVHGIVHLLDLVGAQGRVGDHLRPATLLPESVEVLDALRRLQADRQQMAVVVNEHSGIEGIVTLEDLLEEIVGDLFDEFDPDLRAVERDARGGVVLPGDYPVHDLSDLGIELPEGPYATLAGWVLSHLGHLADAGEAVEAEGWRAEVLEVKGRAITRVRLSPAPPASTAS